MAERLLFRSVRNQSREPYFSIHFPGEFPYGNRLSLSNDSSAVQAAGEKRHLNRGLGLFDSTMIVAGSMIGSGIFIVAAEMAREIGSAGWLLVAWVIAG